MSIVTWLNRGDFVNVYSRKGKKHKVQITKAPHGHDVGGSLNIDFGEDHSAYFNKKKQRWETWAF